MKVLSQLLGRYSEHNKPLILFRLPDTNILLYRLSDIKPLFNIPTFPFKIASYKNCYRDHEDTYLDTKVLADLAHQFNRNLLAELCKLKPNDYNVGLADAILQTFPRFKRAPKEEHIWESVQLPLENMEDVIEREGEKSVKAEPVSPPSVHQAMPETRNAMALDKVLLSSNELRRQNVLDSEYPPNKRQKVIAALSPSHHNSNGATESTNGDREKRPHSLSAVTPTTSVQQSIGSKQIRKFQFYPSADNEENANTNSPQPTTTPTTPNSHNKKRLSIKHKNSLNLTIFAPSYHEQLAGVKSAPINSNFSQRQQQPPPNQQIHQHGANYANHLSHNSAVGSHLQNIAPASATIARPPFAHQASPRRHEFAIPPIVPSQQQPPHSAHPTSKENLAYQQYVASPSLYGNGHHPHSKPHPSFNPQQQNLQQRNYEQQQFAVTAASVPLPPKTPTTNSFAALQRQQYLQPFEHLFDTIEITRTLKSTLDDQIRRSSSLMQTLQASATTIEGLVRNQVKEAQWELMSQMEQTVDSLIRRIEAIENKLDHASSHSSSSSSSNSSKQNHHFINSNGISSFKKQIQKQQTDYPSPLPSATREERAAAEDLVAFSEKKRDNNDPQQQHEELKTPPTIVRSQNDIGPQEYHSMLNTLRDRLDRLERQIET